LSAVAFLVMARSEVDGVPFPFTVCVSEAIADDYREALADLPPAHPLHVPLERSYVEPSDLVSLVPPALLGMAKADREALAA
jgi:hypothetical protein